MLLLSSVLPNRSHACPRGLLREADSARLVSFLRKRKVRKWKPVVRSDVSLVTVTELCGPERKASGG